MSLNATQTVGADPAVGTDSAPRPSRAYSYLVVLTLGVVYTFNFLDRQFLSVLAQPVKADLHLSDTQLGLLTGLMFSLFYTFFGVPVATLADRGNRVRLVAASCTLWSLFSAACGLAGGFGTLALARIGVGIGEAGGAPPSYSIIADYFPPEKRGRALAVYMLGVPVGTLVGAASGGWIAATWGWRTAFFVVGLSGLALGPLLLLVVREPRRGQYDPQLPVAIATPAKRASMFASVGLFVRTPKLLSTAIACGASAFVGYALLNWTPAFLIREKGMTLKEIALYYSITVSLSMALGLWISGYLVDKVGQRRPAAYAILPGCATLLCLPFLFGVVYAQSWPMALALIIPPSALGTAYLAPALAMIQNAVPSERRGAASALLLFVLNLIGLGGGPLFVGAMSDHFTATNGVHALKLAILALSPFFVLAFVSQLVAAYFIAKDNISASAEI